MVEGRPCPSPCYYTPITIVTQQSTLALGFPWSGLLIAIYVLGDFWMEDKVDLFFSFLLAEVYLYMFRLYISYVKIMEENRFINFNHSLTWLSIVCLCCTFSIFSHITLLVALRYLRYLQEFAPLHCVPNYNPYTHNQRK